eukprot:UN05592
MVFVDLHALGLITFLFYQNRKNTLITTDIHVYYNDLLCNVLTEIFKMMHYFIVIYVIGFNFSYLSEGAYLVYVSMRVHTAGTNIMSHLGAYKSYKQIYNALNHEYEDATKEELMVEDGENEYELCAICLHAMSEAKKLPEPCSHKFHLECLMGWMQTSPTCPICRRKLNDKGNKRLDDISNTDGSQMAVVWVIVVWTYSKFWTM